MVLPSHIAIIMDGNGRWARRHHFPRTSGHRAGVEAVKRTLEACVEFSIPYLTLYAFSSENWKRPLQEVDELMRLLRFYLKLETHNLHKNNIRVQVIGDRLRLRDDIQHAIRECETLTAQNTGLYLTIALSYGSRQELVQAAKRLADEVKEGRLQPEAIDEAVFSGYLYTQGIPDPDLLIRTGGEQRLSNFLLWQSAYTELFFSPVLWPDFKREHLAEALESFKQRERRYGMA